MKSPQKVCNLGAPRAAIHMSLVENDGEIVRLIGSQPGSCLIEDAPLDRPQQHVLQHRIVGDEQVRTTSLHLAA